MARKVDTAPEIDTSIAAIVVADRGGRYYVGQDGLVGFERMSVPGPMGYAAWLRAHYEDGGTVEINLAHVERVEGAPEPTEAQP